MEHPEVTKFKEILLKRFDFWKEYWTEEQRGAAAGLLFVPLPEEYTEEEKNEMKNRGLKLLSEHPEWLAKDVDKSN